MSQPSEVLVPQPEMSGDDVEHHEIFEPKGFMEKMLDGIEKVGNMVPHPVVIFLILCGIVIVLSHVLYLLGTSVIVEVIDPETDVLKQETTAVKSLLTAEGLRFIYTSRSPTSSTSTRLASSWSQWSGSASPTRPA